MMNAPEEAEKTSKSCAHGVDCPGELAPVVLSWGKSDELRLDLAMNIQPLIPKTEQPSRVVYFIQVTDEKVTGSF